MDPDADPVTRIRQGAEASVRFMAEHQPYFALLDVERTDDALADVMKEGSDVYASDVRRLVEAAQRDGPACPTATRRSTPSACSARCRRSATHTAAAGCTMPIDDLAQLVGDWVMQALTGRAATPATGRGAASPR